MEVIYHPDAFDEYRQATLHYKYISQNLGNQFYESIETAISLVLEQPSAWTSVSNNVRRILVNNFPYAVFYSKFNGTIYILAIAHQKRRPNYWKERNL